MAIQARLFQASGCTLSTAQREHPSKQLEVLSSYKRYSADTLKSATSFSVPSRSFCCSYTCAFAPVAMFYMMHLPRVTRKDNTVSNARKQGYLPPKRCQDKTASTQASMSNSLRQVFLSNDGNSSSSDDDGGE